MNDDWLEVDRNSTVDMSKPEVVRYLCKRFCITTDDLEAAVAKVGTSLEAVKRELGIPT